MEKYYTLNEVAMMTGLTTRTLRNYLKMNVLKGEKVDGVWKFTEEEFAEGHIENAILIPDYEITSKADEILKDKNQLILVYCRSGNRSKVASQALVELGYTNVKEFGGIIDWEYGIVK